MTDRFAPHARWQSLVSLASLALLAALPLVAACAGKVRLAPPTLTVERIKIEKVQITGAGILVGFKIRNTNPEPMRLERFVYDLSLNGRRLGTGYVTEAVELDGFGQASITSRFDLNLFKLPGAVKSVLDQDHATAEVDGTFYAAAGGRQHKLPFHTTGDVALDR